MRRRRARWRGGWRGQSEPGRVPMLRLRTESLLGDPFEKFKLDQERSALTGTVVAARPEHLLWTVHLEWTNPDEKEPTFEDIWAEIWGLDFQEANWRSLTGKETRVPAYVNRSYSSLSDSAANFYSFGEHDLPNENHIRITGRDGDKFNLQWTFILDGLRPGEVIEIMETVVLKAFIVSFVNESSVEFEIAKRIVSRFVAVEELGEPTVSGQSVRFPKIA
jgi:hypothetical protein